MLQEVRKFIDKNQMIQDKDRIVIGVSGGADSMCLLNILWHFQSEYGLVLQAVHIHHGIRGKDADADARYVQETCEEMNIPCEIFHYNVNKEAQKRKISVEEAGRIIRYAVFEKMAKKMGGGKVAVAHHMNDQAETLLMRLFRGTGSKGLGGMKPIRGKIIRPLLCLNRAQIEKYCREQNIFYQQDYTNEMTIYTRNRIRLELIPYIQEYFNPNIVEGLYQTSQLLQEQEAYMELELEKVYQQMVQAEKFSVIAVDILLFRQIHPALQKRVIRRVLNSLLKEQNEITYKHIEDIFQLMSKETGKEIHLPKGLVVYKQYDQMLFSKQKSSPCDFSYKLNVPGRQYIQEIGKNIKIEVVDKIENEKAPISSEKSYTKAFDYDKIKYNLEFRTRKPGDAIKLMGMQGTKKLKNFFIDEKIPREVRNQIPLLADGSQVIWIVGFRINDEYKVTDRTRRVMKISLTT